VITLSISLSISLVVNAVLIWYARRLTKQFLFFTENVGELEESLEEFDAHLRSVHELETFYGDETLGSLIEHSRTIVAGIKDFYDGFSLESLEEDEGEPDGEP
tara:strand:- start:493 stop:801 length:309 start_codon:yes stop_codon:yes gene_type:complete